MNAALHVAYVSASGRRNWRPADLQTYSRFASNHSQESAEVPKRHRHESALDLNVLPLLCSSRSGLFPTVCTTRHIR